MARGGGRVSVRRGGGRLETNCDDVSSGGWGNELEDSILQVVLRLLRVDGHGDLG